MRFLNGECECPECSAVGSIIASEELGVWCQVCAHQPSRAEVHEMRRVFLNKKEELI